MKMNADCGGGGSSSIDGSRERISGSSIRTGIVPRFHPRCMFG